MTPRPSPARDIAATLGAFAALTGCAVIARREPLGEWERRVFGRCNGLPPRAAPFLIVVMQAGALGAVPVVAGVAQLTGRRRLARDVAVAGTAAWLLTKVAKRAVGRGRPAALVDGVIDRGHADSGLGFPSGHAAVSTALAVTCAPALPPAIAVGSSVVVLVTMTARMFVGAHMPLDTIAGVFLGAGIGLAVRALPFRDRPGLA